MQSPATILPLPKLAPVVEMLPPEERDLVFLIANGIVDFSIKEANDEYQTRQGNTLSAH